MKAVAVFHTRLPSRRSRRRHGKADSLTGSIK